MILTKKIELIKVNIVFNSEPEIHNSTTIFVTFLDVIIDDLL